MASPTRTNVLIVDYQPLVARGLAALLRDEVGVNALMSSGRLDSLDDEILDFSADVVIVGFDSHQPQSVECAQVVAESELQPRLVLLLEPTTDLTAGQLVSLGAASAVSRFASLDEVVLAIRQTLAGGHALDTSMAARLMGELSAALRRADGQTTSESLTRRELQVLTLVADGLPNRAVANELHISENTVKNHMRSVHEKLGVHTRTEAVVKAARDGLLGLH